MPRKISVGLDLSSPADLPVNLDAAVSAGFDFVIAPLFHPRFRRDADGVSERRDGPGTRSDLVMTSDRWSACVVGKLSPWLDLDSPVTAARLASEKALKQEVAWASHLTGALRSLEQGVFRSDFECADMPLFLHRHRS